MGFHISSIAAALFLAATAGQAQESDLDKALKAAQGDPKPGPGLGQTSPAAQLKLIDVSLDALFFVGGSTQKDAQTQILQGGGHDPKRRGFTTQNIELSVAGAVDPYFSAEAHIIYFIDPFEGETLIELEEAFATTTALPHGLQLRAGQFFTEFGRINSQHPHVWDFQDQPIINTRLFGPDGMRGTGARVGWLMPVPFYSELQAGVQNANGETLYSFMANDEVYTESPVGGRQFVEKDTDSLADFVYLLRWKGSFDANPTITITPGLSALFGPNATGHRARTSIFGADLKVKWKPEQNERGWPFVLWQTEWMMRKFKAAGQDFDPDGAIVGDEFRVDSETLEDLGLYTYLLYGFQKNWVVGIRFEMASSKGDTIDPATGLDATEGDPLRDKRSRISAMVGWHPTEFSRIRLQYNYDKADHLDTPLLDDDVAHAVWLGFEFFFGAHPAHTY